MTSVAVVYHSAFGHTRVQAEAVARGAAEVEGVRVALIPVEELPPPDAKGAYAPAWEALNQADAIIFGCPTYMGSVSAALKVFMESSSKLWMAQAWRDKLAAGFTNSAAWSGDKLNALEDMFMFCCQHGMIWVGLDLMSGYCTTDGTPEDLNRVGSWMGAMAQCNADEGPETSPPEADLKTAAYLGARVARAAVRWGRV